MKFYENSCLLPTFINNQANGLKWSDIKKHGISNVLEQAVTNPDPWEQLIIGVSFGYLISTISESLLHRLVLHADRDTRRFWVKHPIFCGHLTRAYYRHSVIHHSLTLRKSHILQFECIEEQQLLDSFLPIKQRHKIINERYGLSASSRVFFSYNLLLVPLIIMLAYLAGPWVMLGAVPWFFVAPMLSKFVHPYTHININKETAQENPLLKWVL